MISRVVEQVREPGYGSYGSSFGKPSSSTPAEEEVYGGDESEGEGPEEF